MSLKYKWVLMWVVCLSFEAPITGCEVVWVNRNVNDSFRVGEGGCANDASVCTNVSATCQDDGSCLCDEGSPNFRNPIIEASDGKYMYGSTHGCIGNSEIRIGAETLDCMFKPFQVLQYSQTHGATNFSQNEQLGLGCSAEKILVKFPDNATEVELQWLNESYDISVSGKDLFFKWKRSVPALRGTIVTFDLRCEVTFQSYKMKCLRAKILGRWPGETKETKATSTFMATGPPTTLKLNPSHTITMSLPTTSDSPTPDKVSESDGGSSGTIIIIVVVVPLVLLIVVVVVLWWLCKRKRRNSNLTKSGRGKPGQMNGSTGHTDGNSQPNVGYSTSGNEQVMVQGDLAYETSNFQNSKPTSQEYPGYETPDFKRKDVERVNSYPEPGYESADLKRKEVNAAPSNSTYSLPDKNTGEGNADIKRVEVNGELYALPEKKGNGLNYMDPSRLVSGGSDKNESQKETNEPTEYAQIIGVLKPAAKEKEKK